MAPSDTLLDDIVGTETGAADPALATGLADDADFDGDDDDDEEDGQGATLLTAGTLLQQDDIEIGAGSNFLDEVRMGLCDESVESGCKLTVIMCNAATRVSSQIAIVGPGLLKQVPTLMQPDNFRMVRDTLAEAVPMDLENWIEMPSGHNVMGTLVACWTSKTDPDPYFMLRRFYRGTPEAAPYIATWRGSGMISDLPLSRVVNLSHVAIGGKAPVPMAKDARLNALKIVSLAWIAMAFRLNPSIIAGRVPTLRRVEAMAAGQYQ